MRKSLVLGLSLILLVLICHRIYQRFQRGALQVTFFDVGQGDSALLLFPGGKTILVDAGGGPIHRGATIEGGPDLGTKELFPELARMGILHLDVAFLTHPDWDHAYGFHGILQELSVGELWLNSAFMKLSPPNPLLDSLVRKARLRGTPIREFSKAAEFTLQGVRLHVIPLHGDGKTNDESLVLFVEFAGCTAFFSGDVEAPSERELTRFRLPRSLLLKVAHHGSKTSSTESFLRWAFPRWAVISVGARNHYGHPSPVVLRRLKAHGISIFRTDFHGYVRFSFSSKGEVECETALGSCGRARCVPD